MLFERLRNLPLRGREGWYKSALFCKIRSKNALLSIKAIFARVFSKIEGCSPGRFPSLLARERAEGLVIAGVQKPAPDRAYRRTGYLP
jgi:hypothetical protein